jgi:hypothetical protein
MDSRQAQAQIQLALENFLGRSLKRLLNSAESARKTLQAAGQSIFSKILLVPSIQILISETSV